jgi:hypothetical protein
MNGIWHSIEKKPKVFGLKVDHALAVDPNEFYQITDRNYR